MRTDHEGNFVRGGYPRHSKLNTIVTAAVFIIVGLLFLGRNFGVIDSYLFDILVSWQMLLIVVGIVNLIKRHFLGGVITIAVGAYFLLPDITGIEGEWAGMFWPVLLILVGIMILFKPRHHCFNGHGEGRWPEYAKEVYSSEDGFVVSDNTFGSVRQIVLDPVFRGARIKNTFGGTILDLRRSKLEAPQTCIDIDCTFGGVEIYLPADWNLQTQIDALIGGCDDKRYNTSVEIDLEHTLIVRGKVSFGGIEFKS
ncbi:LiaF transmembrane domain-containing protein [Parabacteroides sp.]